MGGGGGGDVLYVAGTSYENSKSVSPLRDAVNFVCACVRVYAQPLLRLETASVCAPRMPARAGQAGGLAGSQTQHDVRPSNVCRIVVGVKIRDRKPTEQETVTAAAVRAKHVPSFFVGMASRHDVGKSELIPRCARGYVELVCCTYGAWSCTPSPSHVRLGPLPGSAVRQSGRRVSDTG